MSRKFITFIAAGAVALSGIAATTAPANASDKKLRQLLTGAAALVIIGSALNQADARDRDRGYVTRSYPPYGHAYGHDRARWERERQHRREEARLKRQREIARLERLRLERLAERRREAARLERLRLERLAERRRAEARRERREEHAHRHHRDDHLRARPLPERVERYRYHN